MSADGPLWAIASIVLLGALVTLCTKCRNSNELKEDANPRKKSRSVNTNPAGFQIVRSYTVGRTEQIHDPETNQLTRNTVRNSRKGINVEPIFQNTSAESPQQPCDGAYIIPTAMDYYNCGNFLQPPAEHDGQSYVNVVITDGSESEADETADYENIYQLKNNTRNNSGTSEDEYTDPDYVNATLPRR
ncbi:linker for activation of T-cells family member 2 isoform X2 [Ambystoma mexicanum]